MATTYGYEDICEKPFRKISERTVVANTATRSLVIIGVCTCLVNTEYWNTMGYTIGSYLVLLSFDSVQRDRII